MGPRALHPMLVVALLTAAPVACAAQDEPVAEPDLETRLILKTAAGKEATSFASGEPITFAVTIRNLAKVPRTLTLPSSQTHDCLVYVKGAGAGGRQEVWRFSRGMMFAQVITEVTLAPGESRTFTAAWSQIGRDGKPAPPGDYEAVGLIPGTTPDRRPPPVIFTIRPSAPPGDGR